MPQLQLPFFPEGISLINQNVGFMRKDNSITYLYGNLPIFTHDVDDIRSFKMITSQLHVNGSATQAEICRAFGVSKSSVLRSVKLYREKGVAGFFAQRKCRGPAVLTPPVVAKVQQRLDEGATIPDIAREMDLKADTLHKAARAGTLHKPQKKRPASAS